MPRFPVPARTHRVTRKASNTRRATLPAANDTTTRDMTLVDRDISPDFHYSEVGARIGLVLAGLDKSPRAITYFADHCKSLPSYYYWYLLGTLWVSYTGFSDLALWKELFSSTRKNRATSLMKPSELYVLDVTLPDPVTVYRAHRPGETDWIAYTIAPAKAAEFAYRRDVSEVKEYQVDKADILALFLRRGEAEVLVLDKSKARLVRTIPVLFQKESN